MRSLNLLFAIWIALLAALANSLPTLDDMGDINDLVPFNITGSAGSKHGLDFLSNLESRSEKNIECWPKDYLNADPGDYWPGIQALEKRKGKLTLKGRYCEPLHCQRGATIYACNANKGRLFLEYKSIGHMARKVIKECCKRCNWLTGINYQPKQKYKVVLVRDAYVCDY
ncbi:hypothetical protein BJX64DRAFT_287477 [Aspergillus heterothallicus]